MPMSADMFAPRAMRGQYLAHVVGNTPLCDEHFRLTLAVRGFPPTRPGQFIQIACDGPADVFAEREVEWPADRPPQLTAHDLHEPSAILRRPFSLAGRRDQGDTAELEIIHRVVGTGTRWLAALAPGQPVNILGPLGNSFSLPPPGGLAILIGGGVGIPPMLYLATALAGRRAIAFCGATSARLFPLKLAAGVPPAHEPEPRTCLEEFAACGISSVISTDDGSLGYRGLITQALEGYLDAHPSDCGPGTILYTCGPEGMMQRIARIAANRGLACQVAVERAMACGVGTCQSCVIRVRKPDPSRPPLPGRDWCYRLACTDGPVFEASQLLW